MTVVIARLMFVAPVCSDGDVVIEAAQLAGLQAFERARVAYDAVARERATQTDRAHAKPRTNRPVRMPIIVNDGPDCTLGAP
jgi:hypothetical protein